MGFVSEDGTVTGSIDANQLDEIDPKTDEAKAQLEALKAERDAGQKQAAEDAEAKAEQEKAQAAQSGAKADEKADDKAEPRKAAPADHKPADKKG